MNRRIKLAVRVEKDILERHITLKQTVKVEFHVASNMCDECVKGSMGDTWDVVIQVRQEGKRGFEYIEQLIADQGSLSDLIIAMNEERGGVDFYFASIQDSNRLLSLFTNHFPCKVEHSQKRVSDTNLQRTVHVTLPPIWKGDIVLPPVALVGHPRICFVAKLSSSVHLIDCLSLQPLQFSGVSYWRDIFLPFLTPPISRTVEGTILDMVEDGTELTLMRDDDCSELVIRTHLQQHLEVGDTILGYDLRNVYLTEEGGIEDPQLQQLEQFWRKIGNRSDAKRKKPKKRNKKRGRRGRDEENSSDEEEMSKKVEEEDEEHHQERKISETEDESIGRFVFPEVIIIKKC